MSNARNEKYLKKFSCHLKAVRKKKQLTMGQVAAKARMELNSLYRIEKGKVDISICTLVAIAGALDVNPDYLLRFEKS